MNEQEIKFIAPKRLRQALFTMIWLTVMAFPLVVMRNDTAADMIIWRWGRFIVLFPATFIISYVWYYLIERKNQGAGGGKLLTDAKAAIGRMTADRRVRIGGIAALVVFVIVYPFIGSLYNTSIMSTALIYVILGLGLNIIIGWGGLLNLGYAAFFAIGAYTYALLYRYAGVGFWLALPLGGIVSALAGILVGFPVLRLRGDYLAIVTLAFGEIVRIVLNNLGPLTGGPDGISQIPRPNLFGLTFKLQGSINLTYFIALLAVVFTVFVMRRIENSRWGRAWEAMREDEIAAQSMGVDITNAKLTTFALGSFFAGIAGVIMAAKTTQVTPDAFGLMESVMVLSIVILGGKGSIPGVILGALILKLLPEYFRAFSSYRMLIFSLVLVLMMVFKPDGMISKVRKKFILNDAPSGAASPAGTEGGEA
jgi:branched-chain amino acid transport system permease protein